MHLVCMIPMAVEISVCRQFGHILFVFVEVSVFHIDCRESMRFVEEIWGSEWRKNSSAHKVMLTLQRLAEVNDGLISEGQFQTFVHDHPILLFPAFQVSQLLICFVWRSA